MHQDKSSHAASEFRDAHEASAFAIFDPTYCSDQPNPPADENPSAPKWMYGHGQLEAWIIDRMVKEGFAVNKHVYYVDSYSRFVPQCVYRHAWPEGPVGRSQQLILRANGTVSVHIDETLVVTLPAQESPHAISLSSWQGQILSITIDACNEPPALLIESGPFASGPAWECTLDGQRWATVSLFGQTLSGNLPHQQREALVQISPVKIEGNVYDFGLTILARPLFTCEGEPAISVGESLAECYGTADQAESRLDLEPLPGSRWTSRHALGFRYLKITARTSTGDQSAADHPTHTDPTDASASQSARDLPASGPSANHLPAKPADVYAIASFRRGVYQGAFACSDEKLTRIWMHCATTLRICMQSLMLDGPKRDRMPWVGDQASNLIANAYTFADADIFRRSSTALGRPTQGYANGIVDYSMWWVIMQGQFRKYFADEAYLHAELPSVDRMLRSLAAQCDDQGILTPPDPKAWIFIDWGVNKEPGKILTALQVMWYWAVQSGANLAHLAGHSAMAAHWSAFADKLRQTLNARAWDSSAGLWQEYLDEPVKPSPYPNLLAVLSDLADASQYPAIHDQLAGHPHVGTPFMNGFLLMAMLKTGSPAAPVVQRIREYWGGMLDVGATTFWEDYQPGEADHYAMYNRPFARGLCQAWSSIAAAILPQAILGIRPLANGWKEFAVNPDLGTLTWACATVPTPNGLIKVSSELGKTIVQIPEGLTLIHRGEQLAGGRSIVLNG